MVFLDRDGTLLICASLMAFRLIEPVITTGIIKATTSGISNEIIVATLRKAPNKAYLLLDAHPAMMIPRVLIAPTATMYSTATLISVPRIVGDSGITAQISNTVAMARIGAIL